MSQTAEKVGRNELTQAHCRVQLNGSDASAEVIHDLLLIEISQSLYLPAMFVIRLHNGNLKWFEAEDFKIGMEVKLGFSQDQNTPLFFTGEITALELDAAPQGTPTFTVRGYDRLHRLQRGRKTRSFQQVSDSDLVQQIAGEAGMQAEVTDTGEVYDYVFQNNETNLDFLQRRVNRIGFELYVEGQTLKLRKPEGSDKAVAATAEWGKNLTTFTSRISTGQQVEEVVVRGWDERKKQEIVGNARSSDFRPSIGDKKSGAEQARQFGQAKLLALYRPVSGQAEAEKIAKAIYDDLTGRYVQVKGKCYGEAALVPGKPLEIGNIGPKNSGKYYLTACTHRYHAGNYETLFEASGRQAGLLLELLRTEPGQTATGPVIGVVTNNHDPENRGRVKVKFPWLGQDIESNWARLAAPATGNDYGFFFLPEVNDEVLVDFEQGDIERPYLIGSLWNGQDAPPKKVEAVLDGAGKVKERLIKTRSGHTISFDDSDDAPKLQITDKTGKHKVILDSNSAKITIESEEGDLELKAAKGKLLLEAMNIEMQGTASAKLNSGGQVEIQGSVIKLN